jgi:hypothetical protein
VLESLLTLSSKLHHTHFLAKRSQQRFTPEEVSKALQILLRHVSERLSRFLRIVRFYTSETFTDHTLQSSSSPSTTPTPSLTMAFTTSSTLGSPLALFCVQYDLPRSAAGLIYLAE